MKYDFVTSDTHLGHGRIQEFVPGRPGNTVDEMNEAIIELWNGHVPINAKVLCLGDMCMGKLEDSLKLISRLNGHKFLLPGNHDRCWHRKKGYEKWIPKYIDAGFEEIFNKDYMRIEFGLSSIQVSHFPPFGDSGHEDRYIDFRPPYQKRLLHGHTHSDLKQLGPWVDVGMDGHDYKPWAIEELEALLKVS